MTTETAILIEFRNSIVNFFDELIDQFPGEQDLTIARIFLKDQIPIKEVLDIFNHKINSENGKLKKMVKERNESFFLDNNVFDSLSSDKVNHFKKLWKSGSLDAETKKVVWLWIDSFIRIGAKYEKLKK